jgi:hypothetical protein
MVTNLSNSSFQLSKLPLLVLGNYAEGFINIDSSIFELPGKGLEKSKSLN